MKNEQPLTKIYNYLDKLLDKYSDLTETIDAEKRFWDYAEEYIFKNIEELDKINFENALYDVAFFKEKQGFLYGFNYALNLLGISEWAISNLQPKNLSEK